MVGLIFFSFINTKALKAQTIETYFVTISFNGVPKEGIFNAISQEGSFWLEPQAFNILGIIAPDFEPKIYRGRAFLPLNSVAGIHYHFDQTLLELYVKCPSSCFPESRLSIESEIFDTDPTPLGVFLNYDLLAEKNSTHDYVGGVGEFGIFSNLGAGNVSFTGHSLNGERQITRLESKWIIDYPKSRHRLVIGDGITQNGGWGNSLRFGGIQFGTDFATQPGFISFPTPSIAGSASLPSTAEIFVNGVRRGQIDIEPGNFTIEQPPIITGSGNLVVVMKDLLGRETILNQPFYASRNLLKTGLVDFSFELGFLRKNYGVKSNDYDQAFVAGGYRKGLSQNFTAGMKLEASAKMVTIGPSIDWHAPFGGVISGAGALSVQDGQTGGLLQIDFAWETEKIGINISNELITANFSRLGANSAKPEPRMRNSANVGFEVSPDSNLSLNYTRIDERIEADFEIASANYSLQVGEFGSLNFNLSRTFGENRDTALFLIFTTRLGETSHGSGSLSKNANKWRGTINASHEAPSDGGFGYRGEFSKDDNQRAQAGLTYNSNKGIVSLDHSRTKNLNSTRLGVRGSAVFMKGQTFLANPIYNSFALVKVANFAGVDVSHDNRAVAKTNENGYALVSQLRAFEQNKISINPLNLPLTTEINAIDLYPVPKRNSGVYVEFPVKQTVSAIFKVTDEKGQALPTGSILRSLADGKSYPVGMGGNVYVTGLEKPMILSGQTTTSPCTLRIERQIPTAFPKRLGTLVCVGE